MRTSLLPLGNIDMAKDYIIDYGNNYRKWKSGFIEQWGYTSDKNVTLPISFSNTNYTIIFTYNCDSVTKNLNSFYIGDWNTGVDWKPNHSHWYAIGY